MFKAFIRFELEVMKSEGKIDLTEEQIETFANGVEDDFTFHDQLGDFIQEYIEDYGSNYGLDS